MSKLGEYQKAVPGKPKIKRRNIRFDQETYDLVRQYAKEHEWTFARVIGEAVRLWLQLQPQLADAIKKTELLSGEPMVAAAMNEYLVDLNAGLDEMVEAAEASPTSQIHTKEQ